MKDDKNLLTRRTLLGQACAGIATGWLYAGDQASTTSNGPSIQRDLFRIRALDRKYDLHREKGCTLLAIKVASWPGNEFGLWLPETVYLSGKVVWGNWGTTRTKSSGQDAHGHWITSAPSACSR
jgi:hypothetical protein